MSKKKACKKCKIFVEGQECPLCKSSSFSNNWQGRIVFIDTNKSMIAQKMGTTVKGEYALKIR